MNGIFRKGAAALLACAIGLSGCATERQSAPGRAASPAPIAAPLVAGPVPGVMESHLYPDSAPKIRAESAIMIDARTGRTLYYKNPDQQRAVASTQKLLTALVLLQECELSEHVLVAAVDTRVEPTRLNIRAGQRYSRKDLLTAMMVKSSNDAANTLARTCAGSIEAFSMMMNRKALELGARKSRFVNPHGLTQPGQYSTARDVARIAYAAYREPVLREMMRQPSFNFRFTTGRTAHLEATNKLLKRSPIYNGMKTGYTVASGRCLVSSAQIPGGDVILVQLGSETRHIFNDAERLTEWARDQRRFF